MKPFYTHITTGYQEGLTIVERNLPFFNSSFHFHPEYELVYISRGSGIRMIGDHSDRFGPGDLVLVGANLPHIWRSDPIYQEPESALRSCSTVIYFHKEIFGSGFYELAESKPLLQLLQLSLRGLEIRGHTRDRIIPLMEEIAQEQGLGRIILLLRILNILSGSEEFYPLASLAFDQGFQQKDHQRMQDVFAYIRQNFSRDIALAEIASVCHMTPPAFCRFFKAHTRLSFVDYLNDVRIGQARQLLAANDPISIAEVAVRCGFRNLSNFNKLFKQKTGSTPRLFRKEWVEQPAIFQRPYMEGS